MREHDLLVLQREHAAWLQRNFPDMKPHQALLGLVEELGELTHAQLKLEQGIRGGKNIHVSEIQDAVGDFVIFLCGYCTLTGLSLAECVTITWEKVQRRDWVNHPTDGGEREVSG
jgi:NTP pyrophosphatase (non-canonical NTP hydrolase)